MSPALHLDLFRAIVHVARVRNFHLLAAHPAGPVARCYSSEAAVKKETREALTSPERSSRQALHVDLTPKRLAGVSFLDADQESIRAITSSRPEWRPRDALAVLEKHIAEVEPPDSPNPALPDPLDKPVLTPKRRSQFLQQLHDPDAQVRYSAYTNLFLETASSTTFTPAELYHVAKSSGRTVGVPRSHRKRRADAVLEELEHALQGGKELGGVKVTKVVSAGRQGRKVHAHDLREAERAFARAWPDAEDSRYATVPAFTASGNHLLYLAAMVPLPRDFVRIEDKLAACAFKPDSYTWLSHITLLHRQRRLDAIPAVVSRALSSWAQLDLAGQDQIIVINAAMWSFAKSGRWDVVGPAYNTLLSNQSVHNQPLFDVNREVDFFSTKPHQGLPVPAGLKPDTVTYRLLIHALAYHGNFIPAITVFQHMVSQPGGADLPSVADYDAFFHGFARFGVIAEPPETRSNPTKWIRAEPILLESHVPRMDVSSRSKTRGARLAELWERGSAVQARSQNGSTTDHKNDWTPEALASLFAAFMALRPPLQGLTVAPTPQAVYYLLVAFARTTGSDPGIMKDVFEELQIKFGEGNAEGWVGWRVNSRLQRMAALWEEPQGEVDESDD